MPQETINSLITYQDRSLSIADLIEAINRRESDKHTERHIKYEKYRLVIQKALPWIGLSEATAYFDGAGDGGMVEEIRVPEGFETDLKLVAIRIDNKDTNLHDLLEDFAYEVLADKIPGWEINAGGFGDVIFTASGHVRLDFNGRVEDYYHQEYTIFDDDEPTPEAPTERIEMNS